MKIPETSANVGAYYGNEENGQWQPNGVIIDSGVGGGVVGSGDAGIHRPPVYPVHIPRGHIPGYVMAGAFYPPAPYPVPPAAPAPQDDFEDYMWMENEEEFDKQVMQQLEEEALMEQCIEAMLEDEQREKHRPVANGHNKHYPTTSNGNPLSLEETVSRSTLNPLAAEFVPTGVRQSTAPPPPQPEEKQDTPETLAAAVTEVSESTEEQPSTEPAPPEDTSQPREPSKEEPVPQPETPEVSAADVQTQLDKDKRPKEKKEAKKKEEIKKVVKQETKPKAKPQVVKSEPKIVKKKEVKPVKSEVKAEERVEEVSVEVSKPQQLPVEEATTPGIKPINYAAAAKANKPKKPTTPPVTEKTPPPTKTDKKIEKVEKKNDKTTPKIEKMLPRKNSAK